MTDDRRAVNLTGDVMYYCPGCEVLLSPDAAYEHTYSHQDKGPNTGAVMDTFSEIPIAVPDAPPWNTEDSGRGLYHKYTVLKGGEPVDGFHFVLAPESDPAAREALWEYVSHTENDELAADIQDRLLETVGHPEMDPGPEPVDGRVWPEDYPAGEVLDYLRREGPVTPGEIASGCEGHPESEIAEHLDALQKKGYVWEEPVQKVGVPTVLYHATDAEDGDGDD